MTRRNLLPLIAMLALLSVSAVAIAQQQRTYRLTHLATGTFFTGLAFADINNKNELAGWRFADGREDSSFIWRDGELLDLNPVPGTRSLALAINDHSDVVGIYEDAQSYFRSFLWRRGSVTQIESIPDQLAELVADINNRREVLMWAFDSQNVSRFFVWRNGELTPLEPLPGFEGAAGVALNDRGAIIGYSGEVAVLWEHGTVMQIQLPPGATSGAVNAINNRGAVAGTAEFPGHVAGFLWRDGEAAELRPPVGFVNSMVFDVNDRSAAVGFSFTISDQPIVATLWPRRGAPVNLNTLIADDDPLKPFVHLRSADLINDRGVIVAVGSDSRNEPFSRSTYLLTPQN